MYYLKWTPLFGEAVAILLKTIDLTYAVSNIFHNSDAVNEDRDSKRPWPVLATPDRD
jgi:hypothetical protein